MGKRKKTGHISFWVEPEFKKILQNYAIKDGRSFSNLMIKILEDWVTEQSERQKTEEKPSVIKRGA